MTISGIVHNILRGIDHLTPETLFCAKISGWTDPNHVGVTGGSHGGFLTGHLVGQYPDKFKAGILRNPVLNLAHMFHTTDIPDWIFVEVYGPQVSLQILLRFLFI